VVETEIVAALGSDGAAGLSEGEATRRLTWYGPNTLAAVRVRGPLVRFLLQFNSPLIYVLLAAALITAVLGERELLNTRMDVLVPETRPPAVAWGLLFGRRSVLETSRIDARGVATALSHVRPPTRLACPAGTVGCC
jgi:hypothetical protein